MKIQNKILHSIIPLLLISIFFVLSACSDESVNTCQHQWIEADCLYPKTCRICQETEGAALGHSWVNATCTEPKTCKNCNKTDGMAIGHKWGNENCTTPSICSICLKNNPSSKPLGHSYANGICKICKDVDISLQQMAALGIKTINDKTASVAIFRLEGVTYDNRKNDYGDSIIRMVIRIGWSYDDYDDYDDYSRSVYVTILCCKYKTEYYDCIHYEWNDYEIKYIKDEWNGLYFHTYVSEDNPGMCNFVLDNELAVAAYKNLISSQDDIPYI